MIIIIIIGANQYKCHSLKVDMYKSEMMYTPKS